MPTLTLPAHCLLTGDRVCIGGHWHTVGRVTVENQLPEGAIVHVVLDHGTSDADLNAEDEYQVQRPVTLAKRGGGSIGVNFADLRAVLGDMDPATARVAAAAILAAADDADAANGNPIGLLPGIPDTLDDLLGGAA